jgi:Na+/H+-dicarboxylate symporter
MFSKTNRLTLWILVAMLIGIGVGYAMHTGMEEASRKSIADNLKLLTDIFLRLVKMIIAPLVFSTLVVGIAKLGDLKTVGRVGGRAAEQYGGRGQCQGSDFVHDTLLRL